MSREANESPSDAPPILNYGRPETSHSPRIPSAILAPLAVFLALLGLTIFTFGVMGLVDLLAHRKRHIFAEDLFFISIWIVIGGFCLAIGVRWLCKRRA